MSTIDPAQRDGKGDSRQALGRGRDRDPVDGSGRIDGDGRDRASAAADSGAALERAASLELEELRETLRAIRSGEVDAIVVDGARVYALETAERPYRAFLDAMHEGAVSTDADGAILYANRRFAELVEVDDANRVHGTPLSAFAADADESARIERLLSGDGPGTAETWLRTRGEPLPVLASVNRVDSVGHAANCVVLTDLTTIRQAERALREAHEALERRVEERTRDLARSEQRFRSLLTATTSIVWVTDRAGAFVSPQWSWESYTGQPWTDHRDWGWLDAVHPGERESLVAKWRAALAAGVVYENEARILHGASGGWRRCRLRAVPVPASDGSIREWVGCCDDVDDARRAEEAVRASEQRLKADDRRKDEFIATLAHELRNPLAPIRNAAKALELGGAATPQARWALDVIARQIAQMSRLLDDLLDVSRITQDKLVLQRERVQLAEVVRAAVETSLPLVRDFGCTLEVGPIDGAIVIDADPARMSQMLQNLLNNAAKYNRPGGAIRVRTVARDARVEIAIDDEGIGLEPAACERIFEMFTQVPSTLQRSRGGLGIGLALVRRIVEMHDGTVSCRSRGPGNGSTFTVVLPLAAHATDAASERLGSGVERAPAGARRIVVADDNRDSAESLALLLGLQGHDVRMAYDGLEAVAEVERFAPDVVLLDIGMPEVDGYEAARRIRALASTPRPRLIALTGWGQAQDKQAALGAGFDHHLTKPVELDALLDAVYAGAEPGSGG